MDILERDRAGMPVSIDEPDYPVINEIISEAHRLCGELNTGYHSPDEVRRIFSEISKTPFDPTLRLNPPFHALFGRNIRLGKNVFINTGCTFMDRGGITLGDEVFLGPNVSLITTNHQIPPALRRTTVSRPITLGRRVWIGAGALILPGVTVGENSIIGGGAVVTHDIPANAIAVGNPARVLRYLTPEELAEGTK